MVVPDRVDTAIVGGGLAGLTAAMVLAQAGQHVAVFEKSNEFGGRARSDRHHGFTFQSRSTRVLPRGSRRTGPSEGRH